MEIEFTDAAKSLMKNFQGLASKENKGTKFDPLSYFLIGFVYEDIADKRDLSTRLERIEKLIQEEKPKAPKVVVNQKGTDGNRKPSPIPSQNSQRHSPNKDPFDLDDEGKAFINNDPKRKTVRAVQPRNELLKVPSPTKEPQKYLTSKSAENSRFSNLESSKHSNLFKSDEVSPNILFDSDEEAKNLDLAKKLQKEEEEEMMKRKKDEQDSMICSICLVSFDEDMDIAIMDSCTHCFHKECLKQYFMSEIDSRKFPLKCPMQGCGKEALEFSLKEVLDKNYFQKFQDFTLKHFVDLHAEEMSWCPTPNCTYAFAMDEEEAKKGFECPLCEKVYCMICRVEYHKGQTCKEYQVSTKKDENDIKFEKYVKGRKFKQCAKCKFFVEKNQGCDHMTCRCGYQFCYKCGGKYGHCECVQAQRARYEEQRQRMLERQRQKRQEKAAAKKKKK